MPGSEVDVEGQSVKQYSLPNGRIVHVASSPGAAEQLKRQLSNDESETDYDVYVHSTPEHLETLRCIQNHHRQKHEEIKSKHRHVFDELDPITAELDALAADLSLVTNRHIALDANFDRFGYAAHIRIRQDDDAGTRAASTTAGNSAASSRSDGQAPRSNAIRFWKRPVVRQYFYRGLLWRASESEQVGAYELFFDLFYVGIIAAIGDAAAEHANGEGLMQFVVTFFLTWKVWTELVSTVQWFEQNDIVQRIMIVLSASLLVGLATNIAQGFESTYTALIAFYVACRLAQTTWFFLVGLMNPMFRVSLITMCFGYLLPSALWIASIHIEFPARLAAIWVAIFLDMFDRSIHFTAVRSKDWIGSERWKRFAERMGTTPAVNIEHRSERQNAFVTLIFGYMAVNLLFQHSGESSGVNSFYAKAVLGVITAFCFNSIYFEIDGRDIETHAIRRSGFAYFWWQYLHLPFVMAFILASGTLAKLVVAHDTDNASPDQLTARYAGISEGEVKQAHRWFYSAGLGIALACMTGISKTHVHRYADGLRLSKHLRLALRSAVAVVMICLPAAGDRLNSIELVGIDTALVALVLAVDFWGSTPRRETFWWDHKPCSYAAECKLRKADMDAMHQAGALDITTLVQKNMLEKEGAQANV